MRAKDLTPGDVILYRDEDNHIYELDMVMDIRPDAAVLTAYVKVWWPQEPERDATQTGLPRFIGNMAILEVITP